MSHDKLPDYMIYRKIIKMLLHVVGLWPNKNPHIFYRLLPYPYIFVNSCVIVGTYFYVKMHFTSVASVTRGLSIMTSFITIILKMICVMVNRNEANELHNILDLHFKKLLNEQEKSTMIMTDFRIFRRISWAFIFFVTIVISLYATTPVISIITQHHRQVNPVIYPLVYPTAFPWSLNPPGLRYKIHFFIELVAIIPHFCVSLSLDSLFMMYGFQMIGQFREMSYRIMHIDEMTDAKNVVRECVLQHKSMMRCRDILQKMYGPILLWIITTNGISLCSLIFQLTQMKSMSISTVIAFIGYVMVKVLQTFMYAYTGSCITSESEIYQNAIYSANWHSNKYFMTSILIMLSQKPIKLTACNFSVVSLNIFVKVLNTTMSYFFLLRTIS